MFFLQILLKMLMHRATSRILSFTPFSFSQRNSAISPLGNREICRHNWNPKQGYYLY